MVAGDHHRLDPGAGAGANRGLRLGARRVDHPDEAEQRHLPLRGLAARAGAAGDGEDAKRIGGELPGDVEDRLAAAGVECLLARGREPAGAGVEHDLWRALRAGDRAEGAAVQGRHPLPLGSERDLPGPWAGGGELVGVDPRLRRRDEQRRLGRISPDLRGSVFGAKEPCVRGERGGAQQLPQLLGRLHRDAVAEEFALGLVAAAGHPERLAGNPDAANRHLVGGERAGLVAADHRDAPQRLDGREPADECVSSRHPLRGERERDRHHGGQRLRDHRHRDRDPEDQHLEEGLAAQEAERDDNEDDGERQAREDDADPVEALLQRRPRRLDRRQHPGDGAELGTAAGRDDEGAAPAVGDRRAGIDHARAVSDRQGSRPHRRARLLDRQRLARQGRLLEREVDRLAEPSVGRNPVSRPQLNEVARDELAGGHVAFPAGADDGRSRRSQLAQCFHGSLGAVLLDEPEQGREHDDHRDDDRLRRVAENRRQSRADEQDQDQNVLELLE